MADDLDAADCDLTYNRATYGRFQYIVLIGTAGPLLELSAMSITPGSDLQEVFPAMEVR